MTDDSAFKKQVRARMAESGEKYTAARRMVEAEAAIREAVRRSIERDIGLSAVEVDWGTDWVQVTIRAARPDLAWGFARPRETEGVWREMPAEQLRGELARLTGRRVRLYIYQVPGRDL